jgi:hypothetical protein
MVLKHGLALVRVFTQAAQRAGIFAVTGFAFHRAATLPLNVQESAAGPVGTLRLQFTQFPSANKGRDAPWPKAADVGHCSKSAAIWRTPAINSL